MSTNHQNGDGTAKATRTERALLASELRYRRLFEAAQDGILILDVETGRIDDINPFLAKLLGFTHDEMVGKTVGELSPFRDIESNKAMLEQLQQHGYVRYEDLPLKTRDGRDIAVEFVSNVYEAGDKNVIQCNVRDITERKRNQEVLRNSAATQSSILNALPANIALIDKQGVILSVNEQWRQFALDNALKASHLGVGQNYFQVCDNAIGNWSEKAKEVSLGIQRVLDGEIDVFTMEYPCHSPAVQRWFLLRVVPVREGSSEGAVIMHVDITDRKLAELALISSEGNMVAAQRIAHIGSWEIGLSNERKVNEKPVQCSDEMFRIAGYEPGTIEPSNEMFLKLVPKEEHEAMQAAVANAIATNQQYSIVHRLIRPNGEERTVQEVAQVLLDEKTGLPTKLVGTTQDITEQMEIKRQLMWKTALFEAQFNSSPDGIIIVDGEWRKVLQNQKMIDLWNPPEEIAHSVDHRRRLDWITGQVKDSKAFSAKVAYLYAHPNEISHDELDLINGKCFDRYTAPVLGQDGQFFGRFWAYRDITEKKRMDARFRRLVQSNAQGVIFWNLKGEITDANDAFLKLLGFTRDALEAGLLNWSAMTPPEFAEADRICLEKIAATKFCAPYEKAYIHKDGSRVPVIIGASTFEDSPEEGVCFVVDLTERKREEEARRTSEARYRTLFEYAPDGIAIANAEGVYVDGNASICRMLGYSRDELIGRSASDIVAKSEIPQIETALGEIKAASDHHREWLFRRKDGSVFGAEVIATQMPDGNILGMIRDITERKKAQKQIAEQAAFLDKAQDAILVRDLEGKILFWNKGAERMYGWTSQEVMGRNIGSLLYTDSKIFEKVHGLAISQGEWHGELQHLTKEKGEITIEARWTLIRDDAGQPKSILAINTDITEKKLIEAQFMRAQRMESIGTLAGGIAHDLNNILAPILMSIDILKLTASDPQAKSVLDTIEVSAKRGADIVRQVLSFARGLEGERVEVQPKHLLKDIESIIKDTFPKNILLRFAIPNDIWTILGDPTQVHQILLNLCVNARDAMPHGGNLTIEAENSVLDEHYAAMNIQAKAGRYVQITVSDSGTGIPPNILEKIFEPFFTTKGINKGTGLGLSTVMAIVKSHGGIINVYSEPNKGTTFKVYLPAMEMSSEARKTQLEQASLPRGNGETVLLVDDEASIITITTQTLQAFGYRVLTATDGAEAVASYAQHANEIAVVLTDMAMPIMDGAATIRALSKINPAIKIIAASGLHANSDATKASGAGIKHFLTKPYTAGTLLKTLRTILEEP